MTPTKIWVHDSRTAQERVRACFEDVRRFAKSRGIWKEYVWLVKARPDLHFYQEVGGPCLFIWACA